jgi:hypothetical protein
MTVAAALVDQENLMPGTRMPQRPPLAALATVTTLHRPAGDADAAPLRLTRRGVAVLVAAVVVLAAALTGVAWLSAPPDGMGRSSVAVPSTITVRSGDSLWSIAVRVDPQRDPRAEVDVLRRLNQLNGAALVPGQVLRVR